MLLRLALTAGVQSAGSGVDVLNDYGCPTLKVVDKFDDGWYWEHTTGGAVSNDEDSASECSCG